MIITLEGLSGAGKSTLKQRLAQHYGLNCYSAYGFRSRQDKMKYVHTINVLKKYFKMDNTTHNIERLLMARIGMFYWEDNIILDTFLERSVFKDQQEATQFVTYLMYEAPMMPSIGIVIFVDHDIRMQRLKNRNGDNVLPEPKNEDAAHRKSWEYLAKALPYPIRFIDGNESPQTVFETAVCVINKEVHG